MEEKVWRDICQIVAVVEPFFLASEFSDPLRVFPKNVISFGGFSIYCTPSVLLPCKLVFFELFAQ